MAALAKGPRDHQSGEQGGCEQRYYGVHTWAKLANPGQYRSRRLKGRGRQCDRHNCNPECAHEDPPFKPNSAAPQAASTGTPGGAIGTRAAVRAAAIAIAAIVRFSPLLSSPISRAKKKAGKIASSPSLSTSPGPPTGASTPTVVPTVQARYCGTV